MKISTKGQYGLEAIVDLAMHSKDEPINLRNIAERCDISESYILQIFLKLRRGGIVKSIRGVKGGYILARPAEEITVAQVLEVLEGPLAPVECIIKGESSCERYHSCETLYLWDRIREEVTNTASRITIKNLMDECERYLERPSDIEYYI